MAGALVGGGFSLAGTILAAHELQIALPSERATKGGERRCTWTSYSLSMRSSRASTRMTSQDAERHDWHHGVR